MEPELRQAMTCTICHNIFVEPRTLLCGHSFCWACLERSSDPGYCCPLCRAKTAERPPINFALRDLVESLNTLDMGKIVKPCAQCKEITPEEHGYVCSNCPANQFKCPEMLCGLCAMNKHSCLGHHVSRFYEYEARMEKAVTDFTENTSAALTMFEADLRDAFADFHLLKILCEHRDYFLRMEPVGRNEDRETRKNLCLARIFHAKNVNSVIEKTIDRMKELVREHNFALFSLRHQVETELKAALTTAQSAGWRLPMVSSAGRSLQQGQSIFDFRSPPPVSPGEALRKRYNAAKARRLFQSDERGN